MTDVTAAGDSPNAVGDSTNAVILLDTENIFHRRDAVLEAKRERQMLHHLALIHAWLTERAGVAADVVRSYGKVVDGAVAALQELVRTRGHEYRETPRANSSETPWGKKWRLTEFGGVIEVSPGTRVRVEHTDVPWGRNRGELRLIRDDENRRKRGETVAATLIGGGDRMLVEYVDGIPDDEERGRYYLVIPPSSVALLRGFGAPGGFERLSPDQGVGIMDLVNAAAARVQDPLAVAVARRLPPDAGVQSGAAEVRVVLSGLGQVAWESLVGVRPVDDAWEATLGPAVAEAARDGFADPQLRRRLSRSKSGRVGATIARVEDGTATMSQVRAVVCAGVLFALARDPGARTAVRRTLWDEPEFSFARAPWERIQPLLVTERPETD